MRFKILFLRKKHIYYFIFFLFFILAIFLLTLYKNDATDTFTLSNEEQSIKADVTGDGTKDEISIKKEKNKYSIYISTGKDTFSIEPDKKINTLGEYTDCWPLTVTLMDISRDKTPEIFIQSSLKTVPIQHIFKWDGEKFKTLLSAPNNILGFVDCHNNKTPKIVSGNFSANGDSASKDPLLSGKIDFYNYIFVNNSLDSFTYSSSENFMGKLSIHSFIRYIQSLPSGEGNKPVAIFSSSLTGKDLSIIGKLSGENNSYVFQDGLFMDTSWSKNGEPSEVKWILNFKGTSRTRPEDMKKYTIKLTLKPDLDLTESSYFKIASMSLE